MRVSSDASASVDLHEKSRQIKVLLQPAAVVEHGPPTEFLEELLPFLPNYLHDLEQLVRVFVLRFGVYARRVQQFEFGDGLRGGIGGLELFWNASLNLSSTFKFLLHFVVDGVQPRVEDHVVGDLIRGNPVPTSKGIKVSARIRSEVDGCEELGRGRLKAGRVVCLKRSSFFQRSRP